MLKWLLPGILVASGLVTIATGSTIIFDIHGFAGRFGIALDVPARTAVAISTLGTPILVSSLFTFLAAYWVYTGHPGGRVLAMACGLMLVLIGIGIYFISGITQLLFMDSLRGLVIIGCVFLCRKGAVPVNA